MPANWHFPVAWREQVVRDDGSVWEFRCGLNWSAWYPIDARIKIKIEDA